MAGQPSFPVEAIAKLLMLDVRRVQQLRKQGWIPDNGRGEYGLVESVQGYVRFLKEGSKENNRGSEQARLARAQAVKVEMQNFRQMDELIVAEQSDETLRGLTITMRSSHEGLPGRLASEFAAITDAPVIYQRLQAELRAVDNLCADFLEKRAATLESMPRPSIGDEAERADAADDLGSAESSDAAGQSGARSI